MNINSLPQEVLCMIFDHLNLADVKNASLTCQLWKQVIFSSPYIKRFKLNLDLEKIISPSWPAHSSRGSLSFALSKQEIYRDLLRSAFSVDRHYRHASYIVDDLEEPAAPGVVLTVIPLRALGLQTLTLKCLAFPTRMLLPHLVRVLPEMKHLEMLGLECASASFPEALLLQSNTVRQFQLTLTYDTRSHHGRFIRLGMPKLSSYRGKLHILDGSTTVDQLTDLTLTVPCSSRCLASFDAYQERLSRLASLVTLTVKFEVTNDLFRAICQSCRSLQVLVLKRSLKLLDIHTFADINRLTKLRHLELETFHAPNRGILDLTPLTQLAYLVLNGTHFEACSNVTYPSSIKKVKLYTFGWIFRYRTHQMYRMCIEMQQLTELDVTFIDKNDPLPLSTLLHAVRSMPRLERLTVSNGRVHDRCFELVAKVPWLRMIRFVQCKVDMRDFLGVGPEIRFVNCNDSQMHPIENACYRL